MKAFSRLFRSKPAVVASLSDALPGEVDAAIGAARITTRSPGPNLDINHDFRPIFEIPGLRSIRFDAVELRQIIADEWPNLNAGQLKRAIGYANNRCNMEARRLAESQFTQERPSKRFERLRCL